MFAACLVLLGGGTTENQLKQNQLKKKTKMAFDRLIMPRYHKDPTTKYSKCWLGQNKCLQTTLSNL